MYVFTPRQTARYIPFTSPEGSLFYFCAILSVLYFLRDSAICCVITVMCPVADTGRELQAQHTAAAAAAWDGGCTQLCHAVLVPLFLLVDMGMSKSSFTSFLECQCARRADRPAPRTRLPSASGPHPRVAPQTKKRLTVSHLCANCHFA